MLKLTAKHQPLDTQNVSFNINLKSPIDSDAGVEGSFIFNFKIPATVKNNAAFDHPQRLSKHELSELSINGNIQFSGLNIAEGIWKVKSATNKKIELSFAIGSGNYHNQIKDITLPEIFDETVTMGTTTQDVLDHAKSKIILQYPDTDYQFPTIYNPNYYKENNELNPDYLGFVNRYDIEEDEFPINE